MAEFSDYIVYVDESGDHSLTSIDADFPVFSLSFCVVKKDEYLSQVVPAMQALKFKYWGHDSVVLHEHEIRKSKGDFTFLLTDRSLREQFYEDLNQVMVDAPITIIASVIDKVKLTAKYANPWSPYDLALHFCLERLQAFLRENGQEGRLTHVVFECRGKAEDDDLELTFRRIVAGEGHWGYRKHKFEIMEFEPKFAKKSVNSTGLQLADLTARPLALRTLRPGQSNRALEVIMTKMGAVKEFP
ncbi:DUF3800 domain containing protein [Sulfitobacter noctilucicola]|uniref:DUF3800 domain-containing protein n=1 Tax=Sulfitobacter noctilucicola TaxID=1342301 RepID=A0A7W6M686_9RHOB|nr:DUF3800 domain-containing protein [Sulfitobacter noctilucicola]KIN62580.1 DUF3800 domain containing protein [Sulfitobacter noctilucicola]MBB4172887.1 hypothetical protein [Sulfitobacter noctilucicola]